jgi:DNA-binding IclR family transcriptional regulator
VPADWAMSTTATPTDHRPVSRPHETTSCASNVCRIRHAVARTIIALARPRLERLSLQTGETAALAVWRQGALTYVEEVVPPAIVAATWVGKVLLAYGDAPVVSRPVRRGLERFTDTTITTVSALDEQLVQVRLRGFATCRGEYEASAWGVSAPVVDSAGRLVAVLSIWGPGTRVTEERLEVLGPLVQTAAATLLDR